MSLTTKWKNAIWDVNLLNEHNILNYFCDRTNPFYNSQCNNERVLMNRIATDMSQLTGDEYAVIHYQTPIMFIIIKQRRHSPSMTVPLAYYYIVNGEVMQAPDLASLINARLQTTMYHMNESFQLLLKQVEHHPLNGTYSWSESENINKSELTQTKLNSVAEKLRNYGNQFHTVNMQHLISEWMDRFPQYQAGYNVQPMIHPPASSASNTNRTAGLTSSNASSTPRSAAVNALDNTGQPPNKKLRNN